VLRLTLAGIALVVVTAGARSPAAAASCAPVAPSPAETARVLDVRIESQTSYWTGLVHGFSSGDGFDDVTGRGLFVISGTVKNVSASPIHHVTLRYELLDEDGNVVTYEEGYNVAAEVLLASPPARDVVVPIAPGGSDRFRMIFLASELPRFDEPRVSVIGAE
jgi:hypothetical protein